MSMGSSFRYSPENSIDSPRAVVSDEFKAASTSSSKRSKRATQKRVVSVPIKDFEGLRLKGDQMIGAPPSDSWTWRKYGQKPIKGSPYPRGYYRCSSSKGCPAKKQVERSKMDPKLLQITYSYEHNHLWPASRSHQHTTTTTSATAAVANFATSVSEEEEEEEEEIEEKVEEKKPLELVSEYEFSNLNDGPLVNGGEYGWFSDFESTSCAMFESPILATEDRIANEEMAMIFTMGEEDDNLFADLGELPECSTVFRRGLAQREAELLPHVLETTS